MTGTKEALLALSIGTIIVGRRIGGGVLPVQTMDARAFASPDTQLYIAATSRRASNLVSMVKVNALSCRTAT
jgi:hypothetical protein